MARRSECTEDGTWEPYPTCDGDPRETQDGCNPCPGPDGAPRNRTVEAGGRNTGASRGGGASSGGARCGKPLITQFIKPQFYLMAPLLPPAHDLGLDMTPRWP